MSISGTTSFGIELTGSPVITKKKDAPIDIYYWYDYQCAYCKQFEMGQYGALPKLVRNEISKGTVRMPLLQYPNYGKHSWTAAVAADCIWQMVKDSNPELFWKWHHTVFKNQKGAGGEWSSRKSLLGYTRKIKGIDARAVDQCMRKNRKQIEADVRKERKRAKKVGIGQTPGFVLYNPKTEQHIKMRGAQPYGRFQYHINSLLKK
jgi:protein-disulfide isomerase